MSDLASFLQEQRTGLFDSAGAFTIAADKALEKLAHSQLPDPSYWILKVAQFAAAFGVESVEVSLGRRVSKVVMQLPTAVSIQELSKGLDSVAPLENRALDHLVTGLRALGGVADRRFVLQLANLESSEFLLFDGQKLAIRREEVKSPLIAFVLEVTLSSPGAWGMLVDALGVDRRARESATLSERAFTVPYALSVDGRLLGPTHLDKPAWFTQHLFWDFASYEAGITLPHFLRPSADARGSAYWHVSYNYRLEHKVLRLSPEPVDYNRHSSLLWLRDGVIVKEERLVGPSLPLSLELYVDATDCPADLGGLQLRQSETLIAKRQWIATLLAHINSTACQRILSLDRLQGRTLGGWETLTTSTAHLPLSGQVKYDSPGIVANQLSAHPGFRKKLLRKLRDRPANNKLRMAELKPPPG